MYKGWRTSFISEKIENYYQLLSTEQLISKLILNKNNNIKTCI